MSDLTQARHEDFCYRHPDKRSYILCQRCTRTICTACQIPAPVGVHCPECVREAQRNHPKQPGKVSQMKSRLTRSASPATTVILIAIATMFLLQLVSDQITDALIYAPFFTDFQLIWLYQPWRMVTAIFLHSTSGIFHILFNLLALWMLGGPIEKAIGSARFTALFFVAGFGGSVAVQWLSNPLAGVLGASGSIMGLLGAYFIFSKEFTGRVPVQLLVIIGINVVSGLFWSGISWQAHLGGLLAGAALAFLFLKRRERTGMPKFDSVWIVAAGLVGLSLLQSAL